MTCPHCYTVVTNRNARICPNCGATLVWDLSAMPDPPPLSTPGIVAQKQRPAPKPPLNTMRPLLTGSGLFDATLGFIGELAAFTLIVFALWRFWALLDSDLTPVIGDLYYLAGLWTTALLLVWHTHVMRKRYPAFAHGWQWGRDTWGRGGDYLLTFATGILVVTVLFPLGALLVCAGSAAGNVGWAFVLAVVYGIGVLARRMMIDKKGKNVP